MENINLKEANGIKYVKDPSSSDKSPVVCDSAPSLFVEIPATARSVLCTYVTGLNCLMKQWLAAEITWVDRKLPLLENLQGPEEIIPFPS